MKIQQLLRYAGGPSALLFGLILLASGTAEAQRTIPGYVRSDQSDVTGPSVTSGDQLASFFAEPGTVLSMYCPVAWGIRTTGDVLQTRLASAELQPAIMNGGPEIGATAQLQVLSLMTAAPGEDETEAAVLGALAANNDRGAHSPARRLVRESRGLLTVVDRVDPLRPGEEAATRLSRAVGAYNSFVDASSPEFLMNPPAALTALHAVLNQLVIASLENEDREANVTIVDEEGLACAIPFTAPPPAPPPPPPVEQAIQMCVLQDGVFLNIAAVRRPQTGETLVIVNGERRPLLDVYPMATEVPTAAWVPLGEPVTIGTAQYQPFGVSRTVQPGEITLRGQINGYDYYTEPNEPATPSVVYFLAGPECEVQPYRAAETIRVRG